MSNHPSVDKTNSTTKRHPLTKAYSCSSASRPLPIGNFAFISPQEFVELITADSDADDLSNVPILDCRSQIDFGCERIRSSHNVNCRAKIMAKKLASKRLEDLEPTLGHSLNNSDKVILYDQSSDARTAERIESSPINLVVQAAQKSNKKVHIIEGGIEAVKTKFPHLIEYQHNLLTEKHENLYPFTPSTKEKENIRMTEVLPHLFVGNVFDAQDRDFLIEHKISHVLNATPDLPLFWEKDFKYFRVPAFDKPSQNIRAYFQEAANFIEEALRTDGNNVLVHCSAGISRSPTLVLAFMMKNHQMTYEDAFDKMHRLRSIVDPNLSFIAQLKEWSKSLSNQVQVDESNGKSEKK